MKKIFGMLVACMLCVGMVGCDDAKEATEEDYKDTTKEEQQVEEVPVEEEEEEEEEVDEPIEEPTPEPVQEPVEDISDDIDGAYELVKPLIEQTFGALDYDFEIFDGKLMLTTYVPSDEVVNGIYDGSWNELIKQAELGSTSIKDVLDASGYTNVDFCASMCDDVQRQDLYYLFVQNGITVFNVANEIN